MNSAASPTSVPKTWFAIAAAISAMWPACVEAQAPFNPARQAYWQGRMAYDTEQCELAVRSFAYAARHDVFSSRYYLARIFGNERGHYTDHIRAYKLLRGFVLKYGDTDCADYRRAHIVADAMTRLARYDRQGIPAMGLPPNLKRAVNFFQHAAECYDHEAAQFELSKHLLEGHGIRRSISHGLHWLAKLARDRYAGAHAEFAKLYWHGRIMPLDRKCALTAISIASENADLKDRRWIEELHRDFVCQATLEERKVVGEMLPYWRNNFPRKPDMASDCGVSPPARAPLLCSNGRPVPRIRAAPLLGSPFQGSRRPRHRCPTK